MPTTQERPPVETLTFEEALEELEALTTELNQDGTSLKASVAGYERGMQLLARCRDELADAKAKIEAINAKHASPSS